MIFVAIYKSDNYDYVEKSNMIDVFSLPGEYYVFQEIEMEKRYGKSYSDPFIYLNESRTPAKLIINNLELTDVKLLFTYNLNYNLVFNLYDSVTKVNKKIARNGKYHTRAFYNELSFIVKTMYEFTNDRSWLLFDVLNENLKLKEEIIKLKNEISKQDLK